MNRARRYAIGAVVAAVGGYVAGILTAPKSGKETRKDLHDTAVKAKSEGEKKLKALHSELNDLLGQAKKGATQAKETAKSGANEAITKAQFAKDKARELLSALHEGGADDQDLQRAIDEATKAKDHLKDYLKKAVVSKET